jgi:DNA-binding PadR family transcriptional regulator
MEFDHKLIPPFQQKILSVLSQNSLNATEIRDAIGVLTKRKPSQPQLALALTKMRDDNLICREKIEARPVRGGRWHYQYSILEKGKIVVSTATSNSKLKEKPVGQNPIIYPEGEPVPHTDKNWRDGRIAHDLSADAERAASGDEEAQKRLETQRLIAMKQMARESRD